MRSLNVETSRPGAARVVLDASAQSPDAACRPDARSGSALWRPLPVPLGAVPRIVDPTGTAMKNDMPPVDGPTLGLALRLLREEAGLTQQEMAEALNRRRPEGSARVHRNTVLRWEKSGRILTTDLLQILAVLDATGTIASWTLDRDDPGEAARAERRVALLLLYFLSHVDKIPRSSHHQVDRLESRVDQHFRALQDQIASLHHLIESS